MADLETVRAVLDGASGATEDGTRFRAAWRWITADEQRTPHLETLMSNIPMPNVTLDHLAAIGSSCSGAAAASGKATITQAVATTRSQQGPAFPHAAATAAASAATAAAGDVAGAASISHGDAHANSLSHLQVAAAQGRLVPDAVAALAALAASGSSAATTMQAHSAAAVATTSAAGRATSGAAAAAATAAPGADEAALLAALAAGAAAAAGGQLTSPTGCRGHVDSEAPHPGAVLPPRLSLPPGLAGLDSSLPTPSSRLDSMLIAVPPALLHGWDSLQVGSNTQEERAGTGGDGGSASGSPGPSSGGGGGGSAGGRVCTRSARGDVSVALRVLLVACRARI